jgi:hypothetical protein
MLCIILCERRRGTKIILLKTSLARAFKIDKGNIGGILGRRGKNIGRCRRRCRYRAVSFRLPEPACVYTYIGA